MLNMLYKLNDLEGCTLQCAFSVCDLVLFVLNIYVAAEVKL